MAVTKISSTRTMWNTERSPVCLLWWKETTKALKTTFVFLRLAEHGGRKHPQHLQFSSTRAVVNVVGSQTSGGRNEHVSGWRNRMNVQEDATTQALFPQLKYFLMPEERNIRKCYNRFSNSRKEQSFCSI